MSFVASIQANIDDFQRNIDKAQARMDAFAQGVGQKVADLGQSFQKVGIVLSASVTAPIVALGTAALKTYGDIQSLKMGLEAIMGSAQAAEDEFTKLLEVAKLPGLGLKEAAKGSVALQSAGFSADEARRSLMAFGNALATVGKGAQELNLVNLALTQLQNKSSGFGQDLRQLTEQLPQLRGAMTAAFGTSDSEKIAKLGYTGAQVVKKLTDEFEKLPKVTGGMKNAFENFSDASTIALSKIGEAINRNFDVEGIISKLSDSLGGLVEKFNNLSEPTQKMILVIGGVVAAIGPLLIALGTIMQIAPLVGSAFAVMTGPIGLTVAAIAAAVVLIIKYWDQIKAYFTSGNGSDIWGRVSNGAKKLWSNLVDIFNKVKTFLIMIWDKIGSNVMAVVGNTFDTIFAIIGSIVGQIIGVMTVFSSLIRGDFSGAFEAAKNVVKGIFNAIKTIVINVIANVTQALSGFFKLIGADNLGATLEGWANGLKPVKAEMEQTVATTEALTNKVVAKTKATVIDTDATKKKTKAERDYRAELDNTLASWGLYEAQVNVMNRAFTELNKIAAKAKATQEEIQTIATRQWAEKAVLNLGKIGNALKGSKLTDANLQFTIPATVKIDADFKALDYKLSLLRSNLRGLTVDLGSALGDAISNSMAAIGDAMATGDSILGAAGKAILGTLGTFMQTIGEQMIALGVAGLAIKSFIANPFLSIAAGAALVALGAFASSSLSKQSKNFGTSSVGGATNSSFEGSNSFIPRGAYYNNDKQEVELRLKGNNLVGAVKLNNNRNTRLS